LLARCTRAPRYNNISFRAGPARPSLSAATARAGRPLPCAAGSCSDHQQGAGKDAAAHGCLPALQRLFPRSVVCRCVWLDAQDHINFAVPNVHGDGLEGVYTDKYGVLGVDQVSTSFLCSAVLLCSVSELLLWCVHCTCTIAEVQVQVALLFLCSAPLSPLPGSVSHDSPHLTAHPLKSAPRTCHAHRTACSRAASARRADPDARLLQTQRSSQRRRASAQPCCGCA